MQVELLGSIGTVQETLRDLQAVTVRPLRLDDGPALASFYASVPAEDYRFYCPHGLTGETALTKAARAHNPTFVCLVMELNDGRIAGYAWYTWEKDSSRESILGICIRREYQGLAAGRILMRYLLNIASHVGPPIMSLTVQLANERAVALYKRVGFQVIREQLRQADDEPEYYMEQEIDQVI